MGMAVARRRPKGKRMLGRGRAVRSVVGAAGLSVVVLLSGCQNFFVCQKASCTDNGGGTTTGDLAYVANGTSGSTYLAGYDISKGTLTVATSSPYSMGFSPTALAVSQNNKFVYASSPYIASNGVASIYGLSIGTGGALTFLSSGNALATQETVAAMDVSADGKWLIVANGVSLTQTTLTPYSINSSTGVLTAGAPLAYLPPASSTVSSLKISPTGQYIAVALGTGGVMVFPFNTSTGVIGASSGNVTFPSAVGAYDLAIDSNNFLYIAATGNVHVYSVSTAGILGGSATSVIGTANGGPFSIALDGTSYVYAGAQNGTSNLIYCFSNNKGVLTALSTATVSAPATTTKLAVDSTKAYLLAAGYDTTAGVRLYSISSGGVLSSAATAGTGSTTTYPTAIALTH